MTKKIMKIAFIFPGQGSQALGMLANCQDNLLIKESLAQANEALGINLSEIMQNGPLERLNQTDITQPALLAMSIALYRVFCAGTILRPSLFAGHSLGEYSALVAAGTLDFTDALKLVSLRGQYMQEAVPAGTGAMAAILGMEDNLVLELCKLCAQGEILDAVNFNSPGQIVIAGTKAAVDRACLKAREMGAKRALLLPVSVPSHCALMEPAALKLKLALENITFNPPSLNTIEIIHNVDVKSHQSVLEIKQALVEQLFKPVLWTQSVADFSKHNITDVVECGSGKVLTGLVKRINKDLRLHNIYDLESLNNVITTLQSEAS
ncbi:malonyl-CoA-[acyl-carrier-protein] transacylase [Gammaproteobacteria bacterium]|nr:malonyl-CoA-[acyl-carrier-protein] transacylase [Gammaproteobacteria bacterium]